MQYYCPHCHDQLVPDPNNPGKYLCFQCKKRYNMGATTQPPVQPTQDMPMQPAQQPTQPAAFASAPAPGGMTPQTPTQPMPPQSMQPQQAQAQAGNGLPKGKAIAALVLGIVTFLFATLPIIAIPTGIAGIIFAIISLRKVKKGIGAGKGLSIAGLATSAFGLFLSIIATIAFALILPQVYAYIYSTDTQGSTTSWMDITQYDTDDYDSTYDELYDSTSSDSDYYGGDGKSSSSKSDSASAKQIQPGSWEELKFSINGKEYQLGVTKVSDLLSGGISLGDRNATDMVDPDEFSLSNIIQCSIDGDSRTYLAISVRPTGSSPCQLADCLVDYVSISAFWDDDIDVSFCGIPFGTPIEDAERALGTPDDAYSSEYSTSIEYNNQKGSVVSFKGMGSDLINDANMYYGGDL